MPLPPPDRECVIILKDHANYGTQEEFYALKNSIYLDISEYI
jgi:hypothetical protein